MKKFIIISASEGTMSNIFYHTGKDFTANGIEPKVFESKEEAQEFASEYNNGENDLSVEELKTESKAFEVTYTKKVGGNGTIIVKAPDAESAIKCARQHCFTGSDFRGAVQVPMEAYTKPRMQGFQGSERCNLSCKVV